MKIKFVDDTEDFYVYTGRNYAQDQKEKAPVPAKEQYEPSDKKRIKSKNNYQEQRKLKRGEQ